ncbi:phage antirepressor KilAC domain-containing protein [Xenorhabdus sp. XENO-1]|nr:phage antirepressor KilAC domain-containing protein [Xenorhabdus bovienii subsp. africana]
MQELIDMQKCTSPVTAVKSGENRGTFAHELLAVSYAGWISPTFQLQVNQTFIDYRSGRLTTSQAVLPNAKQLALVVIQAEEEKEQLSLAVNQLEHQIFEDAPKVEFHDQVSASHGALSIGQAAKVLGTGRTRLFAFLRQISWLTRRNEPYQEKIQAGLMDVKLGSWEHPECGIQECITSLVTGKGLTQLQKLLTLRNQSN